jgi:DNA-binding XRE family transcriptional regulator
MRALPRIPIDQGLAAIAAFQAIGTSDPSAIRDAATAIHWRRWDPSLGLPTIQSDEIYDIADEVRRIATEHGYPNGRAEVVAFDKRMAEDLAPLLSVAPGELGHRTGWMYLSCAVMPDVIAWRYPELPIERADGGRRDVFRRYVARATMYRDIRAPENELQAPWLDEDMMVSLEERPSLGESGRVASAVVRGATTEGHSMNSETFRDYYIKRWLRLAALVNLDGCADGFTEKLVSRLSSDAAQRAQPSPGDFSALLTDHFVMDERPGGIESSTRDRVDIRQLALNSRGATVRTARTTAGLRQSDLSATTGIGTGTISQIETGVREPTPEEFALLIAACHAR